MTRRSLEQLLAMAAESERFRDELLADRRSALRSRQIELPTTDAAMLASVSDKRLATMLDTLAEAKLGSGSDGATRTPGFTGIRPERPERAAVNKIGRRIFLTATAGTALAGGAAVMVCSAGSRPDPPHSPRGTTSNIDASASDAGVGDGDGG